MKILFTMHAEPNINGGVPGVTLRLAAELTKKGHQVDVLSYSGISGSVLVKQIKFPWYIYWKLRHRRCDYDVLDMSAGDGWLLTRLAKTRRPLVVCRSHGLEHITDKAYRRLASLGQLSLSWKYPFYQAGYRLFECAQSFKHSDVSLFLNHGERAYAIANLGVPARTAFVLPNGIGEHLIQFAQKANCNVVPTKHNIAFIGSFLPIKGIATFVAAATRILHQHPTINIGMFGTGTSSETIIRGFPAEYHHRIFITPRYDNTYLPELLRDYSIVLSCSLAEGFAIAPLEAMACGLVPIVTDIPGPTQYVKHQMNGIVVEPTNVDMLVDAVSSLMQDEQKWRTLRKNALATVAGFSWSKIACDLENIYLTSIDAKAENGNFTK